MVTISVDGSVLDKIAKIMTYLRFGSSGKVLRKKKKERDLKGGLHQKENKCYWEQKNFLGKDNNNNNNNNIAFFPKQVGVG